MPRRIGSKGMAHGRKYCIAAARAVPRERDAGPRAAWRPFRSGGGLLALTVHVAHGSWRRGVLLLISLLPVYHHLTLQRRDFRSNVYKHSRFSLNCLVD